MRGITLVEMLVVLFLVLASVVIALPALAYLREEGRTGAGARQIASTLNALRWKSVTRHRSTGLLFERRGSDWVWLEVEDGNGNDLRTAEVRSGTDPVRSGPHRLEDLVESVRLGFPPIASIPQIPPKTGNITGLDDPVQFGRSDLVSFSPAGNASSGTIYVTDGHAGLYGIVLFGPTAKVRVWRYDARRRRWKL